MALRRAKPEVRQGEILEAAMAVARTLGVYGFTRADVAALAGCAPGLVTHYWGRMADLRTAVMLAGIVARDRNIVRQALASGYADRVPEDLIREVLS